MCDRSLKNEVTRVEALHEEMDTGQLVSLDLAVFDILASISNSPPPPASPPPPPPSYLVRDRH